MRVFILFVALLSSYESRGQRVLPKHDFVSPIPLECELNPVDWSNIYGDGPYVNRQGLFRNFRNPHLDFPQRLYYTLGSTRAPYSSIKEIREKTPVPKSILESDFYVNYACTALSQLDGEKTDIVTGNRCYAESEESIRANKGVPFDGEKHWNVKRFFIDPHYASFDVDPKQAELNAWYDIYKFYLYLDGGNREIAWQHATDFMKEQVDPVLRGRYLSWASEHSKILFQSKKIIRPEKLAKQLDRSNQTERILNAVLNHNALVLSGQKKGKAFTRLEIEEVLVAFQIEIRRESPENAKRIALRSIDNALGEVESEINFLKREFNVVDQFIGQRPADYDNWPVEGRISWDNAHPEMFKKIRIPKSVDEKQSHQKFLKDLKYKRLL